MTVLRQLRAILFSRGSGLLVVLALVGVGAYVLVFRQQYYASAALQRSAGTNAWLDRGFSVAVVWPLRTDPRDLSLREGVELALAEIKAKGGPLADKLTIRYFDEVESEDQGAVARRVVAIDDVIAVIGHELDGTTIPASLVYHSHGVLFMAPKSTDVRLTGHQFPFVFRLTPDERDMTAALQSFALENGWKRVGILHARSEHGEAASNRFLTAAGSAGIQVPFMRSYFNTEPAGAYRSQDFRQMLAEVREYGADAIALAGELPWSAKLLKDTVQMSIRQPLLATDKLDSSRVEALSDYFANEQLHVATAVNTDAADPVFAAFRERFRARYNGRSPGYGSSQGYDALMLLARAIEYSRSADPVVVATTLKTNCWNSLFGDVFFDQSGNIVGRSIAIKQWKWQQPQPPAEPAGHWAFQTLTTKRVAGDQERETEMKALLKKENRTCLQ